VSPREAPSPLLEPPEEEEPPEELEPGLASGQMMARAYAALEDKAPS